MVDSMGQFDYYAFGLNISSEIYFPELIKGKTSCEQVDVLIQIGDLTDVWEQHYDPNKLFILTENFCMFKVPNVAIFLIENGNSITVMPTKESPDYCRLYLLGTCMGAVLMQREILPLHGSAIEIDGKAYAIVGDSGAGKSTLATAFLKKGYKLLSDDVISINFSKRNEPIVTPAYPQQKLWIESLNQFGMESEYYSPIVESEKKFSVPVAEQFNQQKLPLAGIFELIKNDQTSINISAVKNMERFNMLFQHTYRNFFLSGLHLMDWHFHISAKIVNKLSFYQLSRPTTYFTANELTELILQTIGQKEFV